MLSLDLLTRAADHSPGPAQTGPDGPTWGSHPLARTLRDRDAELAELRARLAAERTAHATLRADVSRVLVLANRRRDVDECRRILGAFGAT